LRECTRGGWGGGGGSWCKIFGAAESEGCRNTSQCGVAPPLRVPCVLRLRCAATDAILRSIYLVDEVPGEVAAAEVSTHVSRAVARSRVVALALVLCKAPRGPGAVEAAAARLKASPVLRTLVTQL
jgi:hypothetical protein